TLEEWRSARAEHVSGSEGWLQLRRQVPLSRGEFTLGTAPGNDIVLERGPASFGTLSVEDDGALFVAAPGIYFVLEGGEPEDRIPLVIETDQRAPTILSYGRLGLFLTRVSGEFWLRVLDHEAAEASGFVGLEYYPVTDDWIVPARFEAAVAEFEDLPGALGQPRSARSPGVVHFKHAGETVEARVLVIEGRPVLAFTDPTNNRGTYAGGRYLELPFPVPEALQLDFNRAFNPPCAFSPAVNCVLAPPENRLPFPVIAGEKTPRFERSDPAR
ncbi:MAG: DUF1684 domain-containing protein, partial [Xanthomonadales bacterium]|nr:DUF1684 domain-containing protein [Xanthomonadales bacterium]